MRAVDIRRCALAGALIVVGAGRVHAGEPLSALTSRGAVQATDQLPILPVGAAALQATTAGAILGYVRNYPAAIHCDGVHDDAPAIQAALNTGASFDLPPGVCLIGATLNATTAASHGQLMRGAGATASDGSGAAKTTLRPLAGVTTALLVDGTPFGGYLQGFAMEGMTLDLANMPDTATSYGIRQVHAYDGHYSGMRVVGDGVNKRGWKFEAGSYVTLLENDAANFVEATGISDGNGVTTINFINFDGNQVQLTYAGNMRFIGGAYQAPSAGGATTRFKLRHTFSVELDTDVEGPGVFLDVDNSDNSLWSRSQLQGFSGIYMLGVPAPSSMLFDQQVNYNDYPFGMNVGGFRFNSQGTAGTSSFYSGSAGQNYSVLLGRTGNDVLWAVAAASNDLLPGTIAGDSVLTALAPGSGLFLGGGDIPVAKAAAVGFSTFGQGVLNQGGLFVQPVADGDSLVVYNAHRQGLFDITTAVAGASARASFANGMGLIGYSDAFTTQSWRINSATGDGTFLGSMNAAGGFVGGPSSFGSTTTTSLTTPPLTVGALPSAAVNGMRAFVTDAAVCAFNAAVVGGGSSACPVFYFGGWKAG